MVRVNCIRYFSVKGNTSIIVKSVLKGGVKIQAEMTGYFRMICLIFVLLEIENKVLRISLIMVSREIKLL